MKKSNILIFTVISTLFSLAFILLSYYGLTRYLSMYTSSTDKFVKQYSSLPKASKDRVVISFTTTPDRVEKIKPMINSLLDQTMRVDQIILAVPYKYRNQKYEIPEYVTNVATVIPSGKDYGYGTKIIPTLLREKESDTIIIALDDNKIYGKDMVETMIDNIDKHPDLVLTDKNSSVLVVKPKFFSSDVIKDTQDTHNTIDSKWIIQKANGSYEVDYSENYSMF